METDLRSPSFNPPDLTNDASTNNSPAKAPPFSDCHLKPLVNGQKPNCKNKKRVARDAAVQPSCSAVQPSCSAVQPSCSSSSSSSTICAHHSSQKTLRLAPKRRNPRFLVRRRANDVEAIAFPLGMSIAAVLAQVLERKDATCEKMSVDNLSMICTSAVRESLANVFGDKFDVFAINFEKSFASTLSTLRLIKDSAPEKGRDDQNSHNFERYNPVAPSTMSYDRGECSSRKAETDTSHSDFLIRSISTPEQFGNVEDIQEIRLNNVMTQELSLHRQTSLPLVHNSSSVRNALLGTWEKSVVEQARANDLKIFEIGLAMEKLRLKKTELALNSDSNFLERCKLSMGISKASFKAEKFKNQLEDTRHSELLRKCIDCLVAGLLIMSASLAYGAYVYSYRRITEATQSCSPSSEAKSWWIPKPVSSFSSGFQILRCQVQVFSRMLFGILVILAIAYLLAQRSAASRQTMPVTFILLLLGIGCGFAGKLCVDTLGGSGYNWLMYWEIICAVHFFANVFTSGLFYILHGPVKVSPGVKRGSLFPYWIRRSFFYLSLLLLLPLFCGLLPFASVGEWKDHFSSLITNMLLVTGDDD